MSPFQSLILVGALLVARTGSAAETHHGPDHNQIEGVRVDLHLNLERHAYFGAGFRIEFALVPDGFINGNVHDEFALSLGADAFFAPVYYDRSYYDGGAYVLPIAAVQWNFYVGDWSFFPEAGVAVHVGFNQDGWYDKHGRNYGWLYPTPDLGVGARYHFNSSVALLLRLSTPGGFQVGVVF